MMHLNITIVIHIINESPPVMHYHEFHGIPLHTTAQYCPAFFGHHTDDGNDEHGHHDVAGAFQAAWLCRRRLNDDGSMWHPRPGNAHASETSYIKFYVELKLVVTLVPIKHAESHSD